MALTLSTQGIVSGSFGTFTNGMALNGSTYYPSVAVLTAAGTIFDPATLMPSSGGSVGISGSVAVTGTFWQTTQPVSIASMPSTPVTGTFFQATQPISAASLPLPTGAGTSANQASQLTQETASATALGTPADIAWVSGSGSAIALLKKIASAGGSAVSIADGSDVTQGSEADAAWSGSGSSTVVAALKAIYAKLAVGTPVAAVKSAALESNHVFKSGAGSLIDTYCLATSVSGYYMLFDATSAPVDGAVTPLAVIPVGAAQSSGLSFPSNFPLSFATGLVGVFSTTGPFTKTASVTAFISGRVI